MSVLRTEIPDYDPAAGLRWPVVFGGLIEASDQAEEFVIRANPNGLRLMALQLLSMAQDGVPDGTHLHFDPPAQLEDGSRCFVIERIKRDI